MIELSEWGSNSKFEILNEFDLYKGPSIHTYGLITDFNSCIQRYIDKHLIFINQNHINSKNLNNSRFPSDPDLLRYLTLNAKNSIEMIYDILQKTFDLKSTRSYQKTMDNIIYSKYNDLMKYDDKYDPNTDDIPFKLGIYTDFKWFDKSVQKYRCFRLEAAIAVWSTFLTYNNYPLIKIDWSDYTGYNGKIIRGIKNTLLNYSKNHNDVKLIDNPMTLKGTEYVLYINGYSTWVKEIDYYGNFIENNEFNKSTNKSNEPLKDLYTYVKKNSYILPDDQIYCIPFIPRKKEKIEIDDEFYNKLYNFELNRYKTREEN